MSREYTGKQIVIYPAYFDANLSRRRGRRVPRHFAIPNPSVDSIIKTCASIGLNPEIENKSYPRDISSRTRIVVDKRGSKLRTIYLICEALRKQQQTR